MFSSFAAPELHALMGACRNHSGTIKLHQAPKGGLHRVIPQVSVPSAGLRNLSFMIALGRSIYLQALTLARVYLAVHVSKLLFMSASLCWRLVMTSGFKCNVLSMIPMICTFLHLKPLALTAHAHCLLHSLVRHVASYSRGIPYVLLQSIHLRESVWCLQVKQLFRRVVASSFAESHEQRFQHFVTQIWPRIKEAAAPGMLIFAASYFEFVRLRGFLKEQKASFAVNSEYTDNSNVMRARTRFRKGERRTLLYTERAHFYFRPHIKCALHWRSVSDCDRQVAASAHTVVMWSACACSTAMQCAARMCAGFALASITDAVCFAVQGCQEHSVLQHATA